MAYRDRKPITITDGRTQVLPEPAVTPANKENRQQLDMDRPRHPAFKFSGTTCIRRVVCFGQLGEFVAMPRAACLRQVPDLAP